MGVSTAHALIQRSSRLDLPFPGQETRLDTQMESVALLDDKDRQGWDAFVEHHPYGWICHLSSWKGVLSKAFPHIEGQVVAIIDDDTDEIKAGLPFYLIKSRLLGDRLVSIPNATIFDPLIDNGEQAARLMEFIFKEYQRRRCSQIEIRTTYLNHLFASLPLGEYRLFKHHYISLEEDLDKIFKTFHRKSVRQMINRVMRANPRIRISSEKKDLVPFYKLYRSTRRRLELPAWPFKYFDAIWDAYHDLGHVVWFIAEFDKQPIYAMMAFNFKDRMSADSIGWDLAYRRLSPTGFVYWEAIKTAHSLGCRVFVFGRTSIFNKELLAFKHRWGTCEIDMSYFRYPNIEARGRQGRDYEPPIYKLAHTLLRRAPYPFYDFLSDLIFRHK
jgi:hypothetical protein